MVFNWVSLFDCLLYCIYGRTGIERITAAGSIYSPEQCLGSSLPSAQSLRPSQYLSSGTQMVPLFPLPLHENSETRHASPRVVASRRTSTAGRRSCSSTNRCSTDEDEPHSRWWQCLWRLPILGIWKGRSGAKKEISWVNKLSGDVLESKRSCQPENELAVSRRKWPLADLDECCEFELTEAVSPLSCRSKSGSIRKIS